MLSSVPLHPVALPRGAGSYAGVTQILLYPEASPEGMPVDDCT